MKKCHSNLFQMTPGHAHNLISSSGNFYDSFLAFLCSSTSKPKKNNHCTKLSVTER